MTIRLRILALLTLLSLFCVGTTMYFERLHLNEETGAREQRVNALSSRLQRLVSSVSRSDSRYLQDFSGRAGMVDFLARPDPDWAAKYIKGMMEVYRVDLVWVLKTDGTVIYSLDRATDTMLSGAPLATDELQGMLRQSDQINSFAFFAGKLYQIQGRPIATTAVPQATSAPMGWLIVAKCWDGLVLQDLADAAEGRITLTGPMHSSDALPEEIEVWLPLRDQRNKTVAGLDYHIIDTQREDPAMEDIERTLFIINGAGAILLVAVLMHFWIVRPFSLLGASLVARDATLLTPLLSQRSEYGQMARIVQSSMRDREQLQQALEERIRLGRELHDGVIQSVFGSGMALSRVQSLMGRDPAAAQKLLDDTRAELNRIILDLRRHIDKADPKLLDSSFSAAVAQLIRQSEGSAPVDTDLAIDEDLVASHPLLHRSQALQFVREAVSNAVRHGHPRRLSVAWQRTAEGSLLTVGDDGIGFDPNAPNPGGRGLGNLSERAVSLGGRLEIDSSPNKGTRLFLKLPNPYKPA